MNSKIITLLLTFTLLSPCTFASKSKAKSRKLASDAISCQAVEWPFKDVKIEKNDKLTLLTMDRAQVRSYYLHEISSPKMRADLALGLQEFLSSTEPNSEMRAFYELTSTAAELNTAHPKPLPKNEVCDLLSHVGNKLPTE